MTEYDKIKNTNTNHDGMKGKKTHRSVCRIVKWKFSCKFMGNEYVRLLAIVKEERNVDISFSQWE